MPKHLPVSILCNKVNNQWSDIRWIKKYISFIENEIGSWTILWTQALITSLLFIVSTPQKHWGKLKNTKVDT